MEALRWYDEVMSSGRSMHRDLLTTLVELGDRAPGWMYTRWLTAQAHHLPLGEPIDERDWVLRQLRVYDDGGLRRLVEEDASPELLARADHAEDWVVARMGGYRLESDVDGCLQLTDLADDRLVEVLDLGLAAQHWPGACFLGRVVPTRERPGLMFEWRPLPVDEAAARRVAAEPARWLETIEDGARAGRLPSTFSYLEHTPFVQDLPERPWLGLLDPEQIPGLTTLDGLLDMDEVATVVLDRLLRAAPVAGPLLVDARHAVFSLVLEPGMAGRVRQRFTHHHHARAWRLLSSLVAEPARGRCRTYAELCDQATAAAS